MAADESITRNNVVALLVDPEGKASGDSKGTMAFRRKDCGMDSGIPFIRIAGRVEVTVALQAKRVSGPPVIFKQQSAGQTCGHDNPG
jgi:hypothetical protein